MKPNAFAVSVLLLGTLASCAHPSQNSYNEADVGKNTIVEFGKIVSEREVEIKGNNTGTGAAIGMVGGGAAGSAIGSGNGTLGGIIAGAIIGGIAGAVAEQSMQDRQGIEYIITLKSGVTESIVQNIAKDDVPLRVGQRVMVQTSGTYRRVLPAENLPTHIKRPKAIKVEDTGDKDD